MIGDENATPATPIPLLVAAPALPATCVPWPSSSVAALAGPKPDDRNPVGGLADRIVAESFDPIGRGRGLLELDQDRRRGRAGRARDGEESEDGDDQAAGWHRESSALN